MHRSISYVQYPSGRRVVMVVEKEVGGEEEEELWQRIEWDIASPESRNINYQSRIFILWNCLQYRKKKNCLQYRVWPSVCLWFTWLHRESFTSLLQSEAPPIFKNSPHGGGENHSKSSFTSSSSYSKGSCNIMSRLLRHSRDNRSGWCSNGWFVLKHGVLCFLALACQTFREYDSRSL